MHSNDKIEKLHVYDSLMGFKCNDFEIDDIIILLLRNWNFNYVIQSRRIRICLSRLRLIRISDIIWYYEKP